MVWHVVEVVNPLIQLTEIFFQLIDVDDQRATTYKRLLFYPIQFYTIDHWADPRLWAHRRCHGDLGGHIVAHQRRGGEKY